MSNAERDQNNVPTLLGVSNADATTPVTVYADPTTHRLLVNGIGTTGPTGATGATGATGPSGLSGVADGTYTPVKTIVVSGGVITSIATGA